MKKKYMKPTLNVVKIKGRHQLLVGSLTSIYNTDGLLLDTTEGDMWENAK